MAKTNKDLPLLVQMYDYFVDREYYKVYQRFFSTYEKVIRKDKIKEDLILDIETENLPTKVYINGEEFYLVPKF